MPLSQSRSGADIIGLLENSWYNKVPKVYTYFLLYATNHSALDLNGNYLEDIERGIYHLKVGADSGLLKNVGFSKVDNSKLRTARLVNDELNTAGEFLREHYDSKVSLIGNHLFQPGKLFFVDGSYLGILGQQTAHRIGLGGYYRVTEVTHDYAPGKYDTTVGGFWESMGSGKGINKILENPKNQ